MTASKTRGRGRLLRSTPTRGRPAVPRSRWTSLRLLQAVGALLLVAGVITTFGFAGRAGAGTGPGASGNTIPGAAAAQQPFTANTPFDSGQPIDVVVPANSVLTPGAQIFILECAAPNGVNPTMITSCDGNTGYAGGTVTVNSDGSIDVINSSTNSGLPYIIYALPDQTTLLENPNSSPKCGLGSANECVLYIGQGGGSDPGMSAPHFFSQAFQVHTDPTDSGTVNPGDGSAAQGGSVSASLSTVTPATQNATADGADPAKVTVTLNDTSSTPVAGKTVSLSGGSGHATIAPASAGSDVTDANGVATFNVTDKTAESVTLTAADTTDSITLTHTAQATFSAPTVNLSVSSVTANPTQVANDGATASIVTVHIVDNSVHGTPAPLVGKTVTVAANRGSSVITNASAGSNVTDSGGNATFKVTDTANELVTYSATDTTDSVPLTSTAAVQFGAAKTVSATASTIVANPTNPTTGTGGTAGTQVTVTLLAADGTSPIMGKSVKLSATGSTAISTGAGGSTGTTNGSGQVVFFVTDTTAETVTISAVDTTDTITLAAQPTVTFSTPGPATISKDLSTAEVTNSPTADGFAVAVVHIVIRDTTNLPISGSTVTVTSNSATALVDPVQGATGTPGVTDASGATDFGARDTKAETITLSVTAKDPVSGNLTTLTAQPTAVFNSGSADANASTIAASPDHVPADGSTAATVTVTLTDFYSNPVQGKTISLSALGGSSKIVATPAGSGSTPGKTNAQGVATFSVSDSTNEAVDYSAADTSDSLTLTALAKVAFGNVPTAVPAQGDSGVTANASKVAADGKTAALIIVTLRDAGGLPVTGKSVSLTAGGGSSQISAAPATSASISVVPSHTAMPRATSASPQVTTDSNGIAAFQATDTVPESVTYTATDATDSMSGWNVTVTFTAASATPGGGSAQASGTGTAAAAGSSAGSSGASGASGGGASGSGGTGSGSGATGPGLAFTGGPVALPWLVVLGAILLVIGTVGRRVVVSRERTR